jgi:putative glutathione S-transferase
MGDALLIFHSTSLVLLFTCPFRSADIIRMLNTEFNEFSEFPGVDLYPKDLRPSIDAINDWVYHTINNGVYDCGLSISQSADDKAIDELTVSFDRVDGLLQKQRFLAGGTFTEADVRLFVTLLRFDEVYTKSTSRLMLAV